MTIELLAFFPLDGTAIVRREGELFHVGPPYGKRDIQSVDEGALDRAVLRFGFRGAEERFKTWGALVQFLDSKVREARQEQGQDISEIDLGHEIIDAAPPEVLNHFLDKVEHELLPSLQFGHAEEVVLAMLDSANATRSEVVCRRAATLLRHLKNQQQTYLARRWKLLRDDSIFESLQRSGKMAEAQAQQDAILERGSIWAFG